MNKPAIPSRSRGLDGLTRDSEFQSPVLGDEGVPRPYEMPVHSVGNRADSSRKQCGDPRLLATVGGVVLVSAETQDPLLRRPPTLEARLLTKSHKQSIVKEGSLLVERRGPR